MGLFKAFATDEKLENEGFRVEFDEAMNDDKTIPTFIVSRMGKANKEYQVELDRATKPHRRKIELGTMSNSTAEDLFLDVFAGTVLKGWENVQDENGNELEFSKQTAKKLLKELPDLYERLQAEAKEASNFRVAALEDEVKN